MRFSDTMLGAVLLVLGIAITFYARALPDVPGQEYGAAVFPMFIGVGFAVCAIIMLARGVKAEATPLIARTEWTRQPGALVAVAVTILCIVAYIVLERHIGFVPMSIAILLVLFRLLGVAWWKAIVFALAATLVTDYAFRTLLLVPLPFGIMPRLPW